MKTTKYGENKLRAARSLAVLALLTMVGTASAQIIPPDRRVTWQGNVGVKGDIPSRTTTYVNVRNAGAVGDGIADDTGAINNAVQKCPAGQVVYIPAGIYRITSSITVKSGITVRGAGIGKTILRGASGFSGIYVIGFYGSGISWDLSSQTSLNVVAGLSKESTTITTSAAHGWNVGDVIVIDQLQDPNADPPVDINGTDGTCSWCGRANGTRPQGQMDRIVAIPSSTTAVLELPLMCSYTPSRNPQAVRVPGITSDAGIEDLTVDNAASGSDAQSNYGTITFEATLNCWLNRVEAIGSWKNMVRMYGSYRSTIRTCSFHEAVPATPTTGTQYGSGRGYGIYLNPWASANLVEDCQFYHLSVPIIMNGATSGNVFAYNYMTDLYYIDTNWQRPAIMSHGAHTMMNLFEGNWSNGSWDADNYWGSSSDNTFFRNRHYLTPGKTCGTWAVDLYQKARYYNFLGNVLGSAGMEDTYELADVNFSMCPGAKSVYRFGYATAGDTSAAGNDSAVKNSSLRHGNWDSVSQATVWDPAITDKSLPPSLYLTGRPSWWGGLAWPPIGPDLTPMAGTIPALIRQSGGLVPPGNLRVVK